MEKFDVVIIGAGPGGYPAAIRAAQLGYTTAIVEREVLGGTCLNWGCIPTKTLIASSDLFFRVRHHGGELGLEAAGIGFDYAAMTARKDAVVKKLRDGVGGLLKGHGVELVRGDARFVTSRRVVVSRPDGEDRWLQGRRFVIASGSQGGVPGFLPSDPRIVDSRSFLDRKTLPSELLVLGGGVIGCEFACMAAQLGAKVTVVEMLEDILPMQDKDVRRVLRKRMEKDLGIVLRTGARAENVRVKNERVLAEVGDETFEADLLLAATGRRPASAGLGLDAAGVETDAAGGIVVDTRGRTSVPWIFAVGDVIQGSTQLAHAATAQGEAAVTGLEDGRPLPAPRLVPSCIFTAPEIGVVGLTESAAAHEKRAVRTGVFPFMALGKALAAGEPEGFVKWIADAETDQLLGAAAVGAHATELIAEATLAVQSELTAADVAGTIHSHPTFSEAWMEAAHALHGNCVHQPPPRRKTR